jgi:adenosylcobinamide-GDP ribazoletransferase
VIALALQAGLLQPLWIALQFLTRLPCPAPRDFSEPAVGRSALAYPLVGTLIGLILLALYSLFANSAAPVSAALLLTAWVLLSGGLHLDGLGDSADAWLGGGHDRERSLAIMKDPRAGSAAVIAIVLLLLLKFAALSALPAEQALPALLWAPLLGRSLLLPLFLTTPSARDEGLGAVLARHLPRRAALAVSLLVALLMVLELGMTGLVLLALLLALGAGLRRLMLNRLGGLTGDTAGALVELSEAACLLTFCFAQSLPLLNL